MDDAEWYRDLFIRKEVRWPEPNGRSGPVDGWEILHCAAPFEIDLDASQWAVLVARSGYFQSIEAKIQGKSPEGLMFEELSLMGGGFQSDLFIPVCSKATVSDIVNRRTSANISFVGASARRVESLLDLYLYMLET